MHEEALLNRVGSDADHGLWICNLAQRPSYMGATQILVPALLRSSQLWLFKQRRWPLCLELLELHGWNIWGASSAEGSARDTSQEHDIESEFRCNIVEEVSSLSRSQLREVAGNSMHLRVVGATVLFAFACAQRVQPA